MNDDNRTEQDKKLVQNIIDLSAKQAERAQELPQRKLKNWLQAYLQYTNAQESPEIFHLWGGISAIAAATKRNVKMYRRYYKLYPNLYVVLVATSATCKKSTTINILKDFYRNKAMRSVRRIEDKLSTEGFINKVSLGIDDTSLALEGKVKRDGSIYIMADEMGVLLSNVSYVSGLMEVLTSLYTCPDTFEFTTRHAPLEVHNASVNILGASTPEWLATGMPEYSRSGGFLGRFIFVVAHEPKRRIAFPEDEGDWGAHEDMGDKLVHDLWVINQLRGQFKMTPKAKETYQSWYDSYTAPGDDPRLKEYYARKEDTVLKIAMILSISTSNKLVMDVQHINAAFKALDNVEGDMVDAFMFLGSTSESQLGRVVLSALIKTGAMQRTSLLRAISHRVRRVADFDEVLEMLRQEDRIVKEMREGGVLWYRVTTAEERREARRRENGGGRVMFLEGCSIETEDTLLDVNRRGS